MSRKGKYELLGKVQGTEDKLYLERSSYDCDWYYGFGYIAIFEKNHQEQHTHTHWDCYFTDSSYVEPEDIKNKLYDITLEDDDLWLLCDLMKTFYTLKDASAVYNRGNSHLTGQNHGMIKDGDLKESIDKDTEKVIRKAQNLIGMEKPDYIRNSKFGKDQFYDQGIVH